MFIILGADGKEYGPATANTIAEWIVAGRANLQTKARRTNDPEWKTLGDFEEFGAKPTPVASAAPVTAEPPVVSTVAPSLANPPAAGTAPSTAVDAARAFDFFSCLSRSFDLWKTNFLPLVAITALIMIIQMVVGIIPILGTLSGLLLGGVFTGGLYYYYLGKIRGEPREIGDVFAGFSRAFLPLVLVQLLMVFLTLLVLAPFFGPFLLSIGQTLLHGGKPSINLPEINGLVALGIFLGTIPLVYLSVSWIFAYALVIDQGLTPWLAMETSRRVVGRCWFRMFAMLICAGILAMLGLFGFVIGIVLTLPLYYGALLYAYEDLCKSPQT